MNIETLKRRLEGAARNERHYNVAETRYWFDQYKQIARDAVKALLKQPAQQEPVRLQCTTCGTVYADGVPPQVAQQEPVAIVTSESGNPDVVMSWWHEPPLPVGTPLYTSPPAQRTWVGLTDGEFDDLHRELKIRLMGTFDTKDIYRAIEDKLKEKNT